MMSHCKDTKKDNTAEKPEDQRLVLDGTANLEDTEDDQAPRIKGMVELLYRYYDDKRDSKP